MYIVTSQYGNSEYISFLSSRLGRYVYFVIQIFSINIIYIMYLVSSLSIDFIIVD